jgi:phosphoglycolate phosphatase
MGLDPKYRAVCFDMDGTLLHTRIDYERLGSVIPDSLAELGIPYSAINPYEDDHSMVEHGRQYLLAHGVEVPYGYIFDRIKKNSQTIEMENAALAERFPRTIEMLKALKGLGYPTGVLTRGCRSYAETVLKACNVMQYLDAVVAVDDYPIGEEKPNPIAMVHLAGKLGVLPRQVLYIGDSPCDYECARDSGAGFIGVRSGRNNADIWNRVSSGIELMDYAGDLIDRL